MGVLRPTWRALRVMEHLLTGALISLYVSAFARFGRAPSWGPAVVRWWHGRLCRALGLRIQVIGQVAQSCLLVSNHISWLDIPVLGAQAELGFLSKSEVRRWPLVGWMAGVAGTLFIERGGHQVGRMVTRIGDEITRGRILAIFPEGTTTDGRVVLGFHPRLFAVVQRPGLRIQPVAIGYRSGDQRTPDLSVPYIGEDSLVANLWRVIRHPDLVVHVHFLDPIEPCPGEERRALASRARLGIVDALGAPPVPPRLRA